MKDTVLVGEVEGHIIGYAQFGEVAGSGGWGFLLDIKKSLVQWVCIWGGFRVRQN
jgi:hypothetical protein